MLHQITYRSDPWHAQKTFYSLELTSLRLEGLPDLLLILNACAITDELFDLGLFVVMDWRTRDDWLVVEAVTQKIR